MTDTFLEKILTAKRRRIAAAKGVEGVGAIRERALAARAAAVPFTFSKALAEQGGINIIAEIKRASPSKGMIREDIDPASMARTYESGGASAISVLTEEDFFSGSLADLQAVRAATSLPVLRKDFVIDEFQIFEAAAAGADAILLIVNALDEQKLGGLHRLASELGMDALVEVHTIEELEMAKSIGAGMIGINNRDLRTFQVSLDVSRELINERGNTPLMVAESGIRERTEVVELSKLGFDGFLIGELFMKSPDPAAELAVFSAPISDV